MCKFFDHPTDASLRQSLQKIIFDEFKDILSKQRIERAVDFYMRLLTKELMLADEGFRDNIAALANYEGNLAEQRSAELLEKIVAGIVQQQITSLPPKIAGRDVSLIWNVPHFPNVNFTGREALLVELDVALNSESRAALIQAIHGLGGVGKTQIAVHYAYQHADEYRIVWWLRAEKRETLIADYARLAEELGLKTSEISSQEALAEIVRRTLEQSTGWLLIFDNVRAPKDILSFIPRGSTGHTLITSRNPNWKAHATAPIHVPLLPRNKSVEFLLKRTGQADEDAAGKVAQLLDDLPLALEQAGAYIERTQIPLIQYIELFTKFEGLLLRSDEPLDYNDTVATTWKVSMSAIERELPIGPTALQLLNLCAFLSPEDIPRDILNEFGRIFLATDVIAKYPLVITDALATLGAYSLIDLTADHVSLHRLVQIVVREELDEESKKKFAAYAVSLLIPEFPAEMDDVLTWPRRSRLLPHALSAAGYTQSLGTVPDKTGLLLTGAGLYLNERGHFDEAKELHERALALAEPVCMPNNPILGLIYNNLGRAHAHFKNIELERLNYERAVQTYEAAYGPDHPAVATPLHNLGLVAWDASDLERAKSLLDRALDIDERAYGPDHPKVGIIIRKLGGVMKDLGDSQTARIHFERSLSIAKAAYGPYHDNVSSALRSIGNLLMDTGDLQSAQDFFKQALVSDENVFGSEHPQIIASVNALSEVLRRQNDLVGSQALLERGLRILENAYGPTNPETMWGFYRLGDVLAERGEFESAQFNYEQGLTISKANKNQEDVRFFLRRLAQLSVAQNKNEATRRYCQESLTISETLNDEQGIIISLGDLTDVAIALGEYSVADEHINRRLGLLEQRDDKRQMGIILHNVAVDFFRRDERQRAENYIQRAVEVKEELADKQELLATLLIRSQMRLVLDQLPAAEADLHRCQELATALPDRKLPINVLLLLADISHKRRRLDEEREYRRQALDILKSIEGSEADQLQVLVALEHLAQERGAIEDANHYHQQRVIVEEVLEHQELDRTLKLRAQLATSEKHWTDAQALYERLLVLHIERGEREEILEALRLLAVVTFRDHRVQDAEGYLQRGLALSREADDQQNISLMLRELGRLAEAQEDYAQARRYYQESLTVSDGLKDEQELILTLGALADLSVTLREWATAEDYLNRILAILEKTSNYEKVIKTLRHISSVTFQDERPQIAESYLQRALTLSQETDDQHSAALVLYDLGQLAVARGNYDQAQNLYTECLAISELLDDELITEVILAGILSVNLAQGNYVAVSDYGDRLLTLFEKHGEVSKMVVTLRNVAIELLKKDELHRAESYVQRAINIKEKTNAQAKGQK